MARDRYWEIAWDLFPQSGAVQVLPKPGFVEPAHFAAVPKSIDGHDWPPKVIELFSRSVTIDPAVQAQRFPKTVHCVGSLNAGGAERQLVNYLLEMAKRGHRDQTLLTVYPLEGAGGHYGSLLRGADVALKLNNSPIREEGIELMRANFEIVQAIKAIPFSFNAWVMDLWVELALERPTVAHFWLDHPAIWGGVAAVLAGVPGIVLSGRNVHPGNFPYLHSDYMRPWYRWLAACPQVRLLNNSHPGADSYAEWLGIDRSTIDVVLNGVNLEHLVPASAAERAAIRADLLIPPDAPVVVGAFRLSEEKRPELFVETVAKARAAHPGLHAILMGEGPYEAAVDAKVGELGLTGAFHRVGRRSDLPKVMTAADVFLHTAFWEGTPNVVLEAQQLHMPVVATDAGGSRDAIHHGVTGYRVPKDNTAELAERLIEILGDLPAWKARAVAGSAFVRERFGIERMADETLAIQLKSLTSPIDAAAPQGSWLWRWFDRIARP